jgi:hypothetical protein
MKLRNPITARVYRCLLNGFRLPVFVFCRGRYRLQALAENTGLDVRPKACPSLNARAARSTVSTTCPHGPVQTVPAVRQNSVGPTLKLISQDRCLRIGFRCRFSRLLSIGPGAARMRCAAPRTRPRNTPVVMDLAAPCEFHRMFTRLLSSRIDDVGRRPVPATPIPPPPVSPRIGLSDGVSLSSPR